MTWFESSSTEMEETMKKVKKFTGAKKLLALGLVLATLRALINELID